MRVLDKQDFLLASRRKSLCRGYLERLSQLTCILIFVKLAFCQNCSEFHQECQASKFLDGGREIGCAGNEEVDLSEYFPVDDKWKLDRYLCLCSNGAISCRERSIDEMNSSEEEAQPVEPLDPDSRTELPTNQKKNYQQTNHTLESHDKFEKIQYDAGRSIDQHSAQSNESIGQPKCGTDQIATRSPESTKTGLVNHLQSLTNATIVSNTFNSEMTPSVSTLPLTTATGATNESYPSANHTTLERNLHREVILAKVVRGHILPHRRGRIEHKLNQETDHELEQIEYDIMFKLALTVELFVIVCILCLAAYFRNHTW